MAKKPKAPHDKTEELLAILRTVGIQQKKIADTMLDSYPGAKNLENYFKTQKGLIEKLQSSPGFLDLSAIAKSVLPNAKLIESFQMRLPKLHDFSNVISAFVKPAFDPKLIEDMVRYHEESDQRTLEIRDYFAEHGCFLTPFLAENTYDFILEKDILKKRANPWSHFDQMLSADDIIASLKTFWRKNRLFNGRMPILDRALDAHKQKDYIVSIPLFLIQMDGIIVDLYPGLKNLSDRKHKLSSLKPKPQKSKVLTAYQDLFGESAIANTISDVILKKWFPGSPLQKDAFPNRHQILHGGDVGYYEEKFYSLKCLLVIDGLETVNKLLNNPDADPVNL